MLTEQDVSSYFSQDAKAWLSDAYQQHNYNYPTPFHRLRILNKILDQLPDINKATDVGCGGGQVAIALAEQGYDVLAIDESDVMLESAKNAINQRSKKIQSRISIQKQSIYDIDIKNYDLMTAMGVIGYFPTDKILFDIAAKSIKSDGYFIVSFRNKVFDLCSISDYTLRDIENNEFNQIYNEVNDLMSKKIDNELVLEFIQSLHNITGEMLKTGVDEIIETQKTQKTQKKEVEYLGQCDARQSTPNEVRKTALDSGFETISLHGIHPHLITPKINNLLPKTIYNKLSDSLIPLEETNAGLTWSSVFIGVFKKIK